MKSPTVGFVANEYPKGTITQYFGENPKMYARFGLKAHNGIDIVAEWDSPIFAVESGTIVEVKREPDGFGRNIRLLGKEKKGVCNLWVYGHCEQLLVEPGDVVKAGQKIGTMGNTGFVVSTQYASTWWGATPAQRHPGTHLHLGLRKVVLDTKGFKYSAGPKIRVLNYDNGMKGSVDPIPEFGAENPNIKNLELQVSLLTKVLELYKQLRNIK